MPRYFFNIHREGSTHADLTGQEFADDRAAKQHAEEIIRDFVDNHQGGCGSGGWVEAVDQNQRPIVRLPLTEIAAAPSASESCA